MAQTYNIRSRESWTIWLLKSLEVGFVRGTSVDELIIIIIHKRNEKSNIILIENKERERERERERTNQVEFDGKYFVQMNQHPHFPSHQNSCDREKKIVKIVFL